MPYRVKVDQSNEAPGAAVFVANLGSFKNGEESVISDDQAALFEHISGLPFGDAIEKLRGFSIVIPEQKQDSSSPAAKRLKAPAKEGSN